MTMPRFRFPLEAVLQQRERTEQDRQRIVADLEIVRLRLESQLRQYAANLSDERSAQRSHLASGAFTDVRMQAAAIARLSAEADRAVVELAGVHRRLEAARAQLLDAMKARKAVELLRERRLEKWTLDQNRLEAAATDEFAIIQAGRKDMQ
jgi:flagellar export protein FliJ